MKTRTVALAGAAVAASVTLTSCGFAGIGGANQHKETTYDVTDKVASLNLTSGSGDTVITETDRTGIKVTESLYWRKSEPKPEHKVEGETLTMSYNCKSDAWGSCGVNYRIEVPRGLQVILDAGSGNVTLRSLSGALEAKLGSGDVQSNGLTSKTVVAENGSGTLELKFAAAPDSVEARTGSGDTQVYVPAGAYAVSTDIGSGDADIKVTNDPKSAHKISLSAGSGDVSVLPG